MAPLFLPGMPDGAVRINSAVSRLSKEGQTTWFVGCDNYFSHPDTDAAGHRLALATLMVNGHARPCQIQESLGVAHRSLMRWCQQLEAHGASSFYEPKAVGGAAVLNAEKSLECERLLGEGRSIAATARLAGVGESTLRKAVSAGRIAKARCVQTVGTEAKTSSKSERSQRDAEVAEGIGTACTRGDERAAAAFGLAESAATRFKAATNLALGGVLCGLPALYANGLFSTALSSFLIARAPTTVCFPACGSNASVSSPIAKTSPTSGPRVNLRKSKCPVPAVAI